VRVAQMGMGVVTVAAQRGNSMKNNTAQTCSSGAKLAVGGGLWFKSHDC
jgi:hypothetical protein